MTATADGALSPGLSRPTGHGPSAGGGRVGPNAIAQVDAALDALFGTATRDRVFARAGLTRHVVRPPDAMVDEGDVSALHAALRHELGTAAADTVGRRAGAETARYLLARRIPPAAVAVLRLLPRAVAARIFVGAIARHAWTFAGSGRFAHRAISGGLELEIAGSPVARATDDGRPACAYSAATFEGLFAAVLASGVTVEETACSAAGAPACRFHVDWRRAPR